MKSVLFAAALAVGAMFMSTTPASAHPYGYGYGRTVVVRPVVVTQFAPVPFAAPVQYDAFGNPIVVTQFGRTYFGGPTYFGRPAVRFNSVRPAFRPVRVGY